MLAINSDASKRRKLTPNLVPCSIHHSGPITTSKRHWAPSTAADKTRTAYFRGRKLRGRAVRLPEGYAGYVLEKTDQVVHQKPASEPPDTHFPASADGIDGPLDEEKPEEATVLNATAGFEELVVWGHEAVPEENDEYIKGIREWISFARAMHNTERRLDPNDSQLPSTSIADNKAEPQHIEHVNGD